MATANSYPPAPPHHFQPAQAQRQQVPQYQQQQQQQQQQYTPAAYSAANQQKTRPTTTSRKSRSFSFKSDKSHGSNHHKVDLHETSAEKEANRLHSKADPTLAMNEAEPAQVAAGEKSSLASLRAMQHKDAFGNPIVEPDRSNPTRSRWERPLDTIRSFEAAIDGGYSNRRSFLRSDSESVAYGNTNKRGSYYGNNGNGGRFSHDSYYGSRPTSMMYANRPGGSQHDLRQGGHDSYYDQQPGGLGNGGYSQQQQQNPRRGHPSRMTSSESYYRQQQGPNEYVLPSNHRSYETVASASGSGTSTGEPAGYQTDPTSSDNSSIERIHSASMVSSKRPTEPSNDYGIGFSQNTEYQPSAFTVGFNGPAANGPATNGNFNGNGTYASNGIPQASGALRYSNGADGGSSPPAVPQKEQKGGLLRKATASSTQQAAQQRPQAPEKRKSWLSRRFSKRE